MSGSELPPFSKRLGHVINLISLATPTVVITGLTAVIVVTNRKVRKLKSWALAASTGELEAARPSKLMVARDLLEPDMQAAPLAVQMQFAKIDQIVKSKADRPVDHQVRLEDH